MSEAKKQAPPNFFSDSFTQSSNPFAADWQVLESDGYVTTFTGADGSIYAGNKEGSQSTRIRRKNGQAIQDNQSGWKIIALETLNGRNIGVFQDSNSNLLQKIRFNNTWRIRTKTKPFSPDSENGKKLEKDFSQYLGIFKDENGSTSLDNSILSTGWQRRERYYPQQWSLNNTAQRRGYEYGTDINADTVFSRYAYPSTGVDHDKAWKQNLVAVLDTGVNYRHSDLSRNLARWSNSEPLDGQDNDRNGFVDDIAGWDFVNNDNNATDDQGHGTHVAGISNATADGLGIVGSNPGGYYLPIKVLDWRGRGSHYNIIRGINYAVSRGSKVINMSLGGPSYSKAYYDAIQSAQKAGALIIAAAGNEFQNIDAKPSYPAAYNLPNIISVAASDPRDWFVTPKSYGWGTNYGKRNVDLLAPGQSILSGRHNSTSGLVEFNGTSMAAPLVAGAVSFFWARNPNWTASQVKNRLLSTVDKIPNAHKYTVSGGRMNFAKLMGIKVGRSTDVPTKASRNDIEPFKDYTGDPLIEYVPTINKQNIDSFDQGQVTDKVIAFLDGDIRARRENFNKIRNLASKKSRFTNFFSDIELMESLDSSISTIDFKNRLSSEQRFDLISKVINSGWSLEFEMDSEVSAF